MGELFPELPEEVVSKWVFEAARDVPEEQAFWRMIVKKCSPSTNLNYMDGREGSRAREAMGLLKVMRGTAKRLSRLPNAIAAENPEHALEVAVAEFLRCGSRRAFNLVKNLCDCRGVTGAAAVDVWRRIRDALASKGLRLVQCEPEAALLAAGTSMFSMLCMPEAAQILYATDDGRCLERLARVAGSSFNERLNGLESAIARGGYRRAEKLVASCFGSVPDCVLSAELQRELCVKCFNNGSPVWFEGHRHFDNGWRPVSESLSRWLRDWLGVSVPGWVLGEKESFVEIFADVKFVRVFTLEKLRTIADSIGMPAYEALAVWPYAQPVTVAHPEAYAGLDAETVFWLLPPGKKCGAIVKGRLDDDLVVKLLRTQQPRRARLLSERLEWIKAAVNERPEPAGTALRQRLVRESEPPCFSVVEPGDPVWLELGLKRLLTGAYRQVLRAQGRSVAALEGPAGEWLAAALERNRPARTSTEGKVGKKAGKKAGGKAAQNAAPAPAALKVARDDADVLRALMRRACLRRRFVTDFLQRNMVKYDPEGIVTVLGAVKVDDVTLAEDMIRSKTFAGDEVLRAELTVGALRRLKKRPDERLRLLRLVMSRSVRIDVFNCGCKWSREELRAMAGFLSPAHVEAYLKAVPDDGLMLLGEASPEILSCRRLFEYCCARLRAGLSLPVVLPARRWCEDVDLHGEQACEILRMRDEDLTAARMRALLERLDGHAGPVLKLLADGAADLLSAKKKSLIDEALAAVAVEPAERLMALEASAMGSQRRVLDWWPKEGPDGDDGVLYGVLRVHHRIEEVARLWPADEALARKALAMMHRLGPLDAAWTEVMLGIGLESAPLLRELIGRADFGRPLGCRFDGSYARHSIPKKNGGMREIHAPAAALKAVQRLVNERILQPLGVHEAAWGFVSGRGIVGNAARHAGQAVVACADIRSCFPSVGRGLVISVLRRDLGERFSDAALMRLVDIVLAEGVLPTGAPTSPALLNRVLLKTDEILTDAADRRDCVYTRYADDLTFSGGDGVVGLLGITTGVLQRIGLELDPRKTNIFRKGRRQCCTGLVVNEKVSVRRDYARRLRAAVHAVSCGRTPELDGCVLSIPMLRGHIAFLESVKPAEGARLRESLTEALAGRKKEESK